jgi:two-component system sensor histidine kinase KdpD
MNDAFIAGTLLKDFDGEKISNTKPMVLYAPVKLGVKTIGVMVFLSIGLNHTLIDAIAGLVALALERARFLSELSQTKALQQSNELKTAILASVSHDLRTPLTSLRAAIESLTQDSIQNDMATSQEFHLIIQEDVKRLSRLVENLLEMARIESGELRISVEWESVSELFENVVNRCTDVLGRHQVRIEIEETLPLFKIDSRLLAEVLTNLIENAAKYSPEGTEILLRGWVNGEDLLLSVTDQGPGIPPEEANRIFDKFYRLERPRSRSSGTGMGLAIARGIVQAHGGQLWVESEPGKGATFVCRIPAEQKEQILSV